MKALISLLLAIALAPATLAQEPCARGFETSDRVLPSSGLTASGDFNGDGLEDAAVKRSGKFEVLFNHGNGVFAAGSDTWWHGLDSRILQQGMSLKDAADVDGDGRDDLILWDNSVVGVIRGNGDGTFETPGHVARAEAVPADWKLADIDGRPGVELVSVDWNELTVIAFRDGRLEVAATIPAVPEHYSFEWLGFAAGDFDGNGLGDFAVPYLDRTRRRQFWYFHWNQGGMTFERQEFENLPAPPAYFDGLDVDGDGADEITGTFADLLFVMEAPGRVPAAHTYPIDMLDGQLRAVDARDLDRDGRTDIVFSIGDGAGIVWGGANGFTAASYVALADAWLDVAVGHFNADGTLDLAAGPRVAFGQGNRTFRAAAPIPADILPWFMYDTDVDGDGRNDVVLATNDHGMIEALIATGSGYRRGWSAQVGVYLGDRVRAFTDFDGDGHPDAAVDAGPEYTKPEVRFGEGGKVFAQRLTVDVGAFNGVVVLRTGELPLLAAQTGQEVQLVRITSGRNAEILPVVTLAAGEVAAFGDADGDGDSDLVLSLAGANRLVENRGGTWEAAVALPATDEAVIGVRSSDFNADRRLDLVLDTPGSARVFLQDAAGGYAASGFAWGISWTNRGQIVDWDRDGFPDVVTAGSFGTDPSFITLHRNNGTAFDPTSSNVGHSAGPATVADVDGDGWTDLVVSTNFGLEVVRNTCARPRLYASATPAKVVEGEAVTLIGVADPLYENTPARMEFETLSGATLCGRAEIRHSTGRCTTGALPAGMHHFRVRYRDQYFGELEQTVTVEVIATGPRRRSARH